jgi:hypothetical protein
MTSPCLSAGGLRFLGRPVPAAGLGRPSEDRPAYWHRARPHRGCHVPHQLRCGGRGCLLYCATWVPRRTAKKSGVPLPDRRREPGSWSVYRRVSHRLRRPFVTQPPRRFAHAHPSRLSLARFAWMTQARLGLHPSAFARHITGAFARVGNRPGHWSGQW